MTAVEVLTKYCKCRKYQAALEKANGPIALSPLVAALEREAAIQIATWFQLFQRADLRFEVSRG